MTARTTIAAWACAFCALSGFSQTTPILNGVLDSNIDASGYRGTNAADPVLAQDWATKSYVDAHSGGGGTGTTSHAALTDLDFINSGHVGTPDSFAGFGMSGEADEVPSVELYNAIADQATNALNRVAFDGEADPIATNVWAVTQDPSGWAGDTDDVGTYRFDNGTRVLSVSNVTGMTIYRNGLVLTNGTLFSWPAISTNRGIHYLKWNASDGAMSASQVGWGLNDIQVATVEYSGGTNGAYLIMEESHGFMPWETHRRFHIDPKLSASYVSGLTLVATSRTFTVSTGAWVDEDILHTISATQTNGIVCNRDGTTGYLLYSEPRSTWFRTNAVNGYAQYDFNGTLTDLGVANASSYWSMWCYVMPCESADIFWVVGQSVGTLATIEAESPPVISSLSPTAEALLLHRVILQGRTPAFISQTDYRLASIKGAQATVQSHATLSGRDLPNQHPISSLADYATIITNATGTESDPIWAGVSNPVMGNAAQGAAAYAWGNHATNSYLTSAIAGASGNVKWYVRSTVTNNTYCASGAANLLNPTNYLDGDESKLATLAGYGGGVPTIEAGLYRVTFSVDTTNLITTVNFAIAENVRTDIYWCGITTQLIHLARQAVNATAQNGFMGSTVIKIPSDMTNGVLRPLWLATASSVRLNPPTITTNLAIYGTGAKAGTWFLVEKLVD